jgi:hypothetical protein
METSLNTPEHARHNNALRAWQLALLRFAITLDNADRLALLAIAAELDAPGSRPPAGRAFKFFHRASTELCEAILNPQHADSDAVLQRHLKRCDDERLERALAAALAIDIPRARPPATMPRTAPRPNHDLWRGLKPPSDRKRA